MGAVAMHEKRSFSLRAALRRCLTENARRGKRQARRRAHTAARRDHPRDSIGIIVQACKNHDDKLLKAIYRIQTGLTLGKIMASELGNSNSGTRRSRRNIMKMGAILTFAALNSVSKTDPASANCGNDKPVGKGCDAPANCFLKGTTIRTVSGDRKIEDLAIGDSLPTMFGGVRPVQWIGRYRYTKSDPSKPWAESVLPVRIARSALGPNVPTADLYVTALHCVLFDGVLVPAEKLINGTTITRFEHKGDKIEFFHIKLENHEVIYAEGAPVETLLNVTESAVNFVEYSRLYGMPPSEETPCVPVVPIDCGRVELMSRARSALSPWIDFRNQADVVRDRLEEGAYSLV
jgi:Hint domain